MYERYLPFGLIFTSILDGLPKSTLRGIGSGFFEAILLLISVANAEYKVFTRLIFGIEFFL